MTIPVFQICTIEPFQRRQPFPLHRSPIGYGRMRLLGFHHAYSSTNTRAESEQQKAKKVAVAECRHDRKKLNRFTFSTACWEGAGKKDGISLPRFWPAPPQQASPIILVAPASPFYRSCGVGFFVHKKHCHDLFVYFATSTNWGGEHRYGTVLPIFWLVLVSGVFRNCCFLEFRAGLEKDQHGKVWLPSARVCLNRARAQARDQLEKAEAMAEEATAHLGSQVQPIRLKSEQIHGSAFGTCQK